MRVQTLSDGVARFSGWSDRPSDMLKNAPDAWASWIVSKKFAKMLLWRTQEDVTENMSQDSERWRDSREKHREELKEVEERRLSRFALVCKKNQASH